MDRQKVDVFEISNPHEKAQYEELINQYRVVREEFAYMQRDGSTRITVWYIVEDEQEPGI